MTAPTTPKAKNTATIITVYSLTLVTSFTLAVERTRTLRMVSTSLCSAAVAVSRPSRSVSFSSMRAIRSDTSFASATVPVCSVFSKAEST